MSLFKGRIFLTIAGVTLGAIVGYMYWHFVGCDEGCTITSVWYRSTAYGALMGGLLLNSIKDMVGTKSIPQQ